MPPSGIQLLDETGAEILGDVGPFQEETHLLLTCDILGGENPPVLLFYANLVAKHCPILKAEFRSMERSADGWDEVA